MLIKRKKEIRLEICCVSMSVSVYRVITDCASSLADSSESSQGQHHPPGGHILQDHKSAWNTRSPLA